MGKLDDSLLEQLEAFYKLSYKYGQIKEGERWTYLPP